jgi:hypothetical protein
MLHQKVFLHHHFCHFLVGGCSPPNQRPSHHLVWSAPYLKELMREHLMKAQECQDEAELAGL